MEFKEIPRFKEDTRLYGYCFHVCAQASYTQAVYEELFLHLELPTQLP